FTILEVIQRYASVHGSGDRHGSMCAPHTSICRQPVRRGRESGLLLFVIASDLPGIDAEWPNVCHVQLAADAPARCRLTTRSLFFSQHKATIRRPGETGVRSGRACNFCVDISSL